MGDIFYWIAGGLITGGILVVALVVWLFIAMARVMKD